MESECQDPREGQRDDIELRSSDSGLELWWVGDSNSEPRSARKGPEITNQPHFKIGVVTGVFYRDNGTKSSEEFRSEEVKYEVLVQNKEEESFFVRSFFGFADDESVMFYVAADDVWLFSEGAFMAAKYEMHDFLETRAWSKYVMEEDKLQEIQECGSGAQADDEVRGYWAAVVLLKSRILFQVQEHMNIFKYADIKEMRLAMMSAETLIPERTELLETLPTLPMFDDDVAQLVKWKVKGAFGIQPASGKLETWWLLWSEEGTCMLSEKHSAFKMRRRVPLFCGSMDDYVTWHVKEFKQSPVKALKTAKTSQGVVSPVLFESADDGEGLSKTPVLQKWGEAQWVTECASPVKVLNAVYRIFIGRVRSVFREWFVTTKVKQPQWRLYMGSDVWKLCAEVSAVSAEEMRVIWPNTETSIVTGSRLLPWFRNEALRGVETTAQDFEKANVSLPRRLLNLPPKSTPGSKITQDLFAEWDDIESELSVLLKLHTEVVEAEHVSNDTEGTTVVFDRLYLHDDFHWRKCRIVTHCISDLGVVARIQLEENIMDVQMTRLKDYVHEQSNVRATLDDFRCRGIDPPSGYYVECLRDENLKNQSQRAMSEVWETWTCDVARRKMQTRVKAVCVDEWPSVAVIRRNSDVLKATTRGEVVVIQYVRCGGIGRYVCVFGDRKRLCAASKECVPSLLKKPIEEYVEWHHSSHGKIHFDVKADSERDSENDEDRGSSEVSTADSGDEDFEISGEENDEEDQEIQKAAEADELRRPACIVKVKLKWDKLVAETNCADAVITRLIEVESLTGGAVYSEYELKLKDGTFRRFSRKAGKNKLMRELVGHYEQWHVLHVGVSVDTLLKDAVVEEDEKDEKTVWKEGGDGIVSEDEEDSDADRDLAEDDIEVCRHKCDQILSEFKGNETDRVQPLSRWTEAQIRDFVTTKDIKGAPQVSEEVEILIGRRGMLYSSRAARSERVVMTNSERSSASFGFAALIVGEASDSTAQNLKVDIKDAEKGVVSSVSVKYVFNKLQEAVKIVRMEEDVERVMVVVRDVSILEQYSGLNFDRQSYTDYLGLTGTSARVRSAERSGVSAEDWDKAMESMSMQKGRDFIEEAEILRNREMSGEAAASRKKAVESQRVSEDKDRNRVGVTVDSRKKLNADDLTRGRERCAVVTCEGILESRESECNMCECPRLRFCVCTECYVPYDPNRHKKCSTTGCKRYFPHHPSYDKQLERDERAEHKLGLETKEKTKKALVQKTDNTRLKKLLQDSRGRASVQVRDETNSTEMFTTIALMSTTAAENEDEQLPPLKELTCGLNFDMLTKISKAEYGSMAKNRLSIWQCLRLKGEWSALWYYNHRKTASDKMLSLAECIALRDTTLELKDFVEASRNLSLILSEWGNSYKAEEVDAMTELLETWFKALKPKSRSKYATVVLLMDLIDMMLDMGTSYMTELGNTMKDKRDVSVVYDLMKANFPELDFTVSTMHQCPSLVIRELCETHGSSVLVASEWPENEWTCGCEWHKKVASALKDFEDEPLPATALARSRRGLCKVGASEDNADEALWQKGGYNDKLKADSDQDRVPFLKLGYNVFRNSHMRVAHDELKAALETRLPEGATPCLNWGTWEGCYRADSCEHSHEWRELITREELADLKMYHAWSRARKDGLWFEDNEDKLGLQSLKSKTARKNALRDWVHERMTAAGYGPRDSPEVTGDPATEEPAATSTSTTRTRSRTRNKGSVAKKAETKSVSEKTEKLTQVQKEDFAKTLEKLTQVQKDFVLKCKPKVSGDVCGDTSIGNTEAGRVWKPKVVPRWSSSVLTTVHEGVEVANDHRVDNGVTLMGEGVKVQREEVLKEEWPHEMLGTVAIKKLWKLIIDCSHVESMGATRLVFYVCDFEEDIGSEVRCCETLATAAAFRTSKSAAQVKESLRASAQVWFDHYCDDTAGQAPTWATVFANIHSKEVLPEVFAVQADMVDSMQAMSQPCSSEQGSLLMQEFAEGVMECKIYHDAHDQISFSNSIPRSCVDKEGCIKDVPVVFKYYTPTHACAAVCVSIQQDKHYTEYSENWNEIESQSWKGVTALPLLELFPKWQGHVDVQYFAASSVEQVLAGVPGKYPEFVRQMIVDGQVGGTNVETRKDNKAGQDAPWQHHMSWMVGNMMQVKSGIDTEKGRGEEWASNTMQRLSRRRNTPAMNWQRVRAAPEVEKLKIRIEAWKKAAIANHLLKIWMKKEELLDQILVGKEKVHFQTDSSSQPPSAHQQADILFSSSSRRTSERVGTSTVTNTEMDSQSQEAKEKGSSLQEHADRMLLLIAEMTEEMASEGSTIQGEEEDMVHLMGCLDEMRGSAAEMQERVKIPERRITAECKSYGYGAEKSNTVTRQTAEYKCVQTFCELVKHRKEAMTKLQDSPDPGQEWLIKQGELMEEAVDWMAMAYPEMKSELKMQKIEEFMREIEHVGRPAKTMNSQVLHTHCADLPEELRDTLRQTMEHGVLTGIPKPRRTNRVKSSMAALSHKDKVWKNLRKFALHGWVRVFPPSMWPVLETMCITVSATHYVVDQDRLVADLSNAGQKSEGEDANSMSQGEAYTKEQVQCDYVDIVIEELFEYLKTLDMFEDEQLISIKADIKSAFMRVPLDVKSVGSLAIEWDGWLFVFSRTPFGWKYATHTFSHFMTAVKHKVARFNKNGWQNSEYHAQRVNWSRIAARAAVLAETPASWKDEVVRRWRDFLPFAYVDDLWSHTEDIQKRAKKMADVMRVAGYLLLGYDCWSLKKADLDGFCALMHKYAGIVYNMAARPEPTLSFTLDRIRKNLDLCRKAKEWETQWPLGFAQTVHGNQVWVFRVYQVLKGMASGWRRCTQGVLTATAKPDTMVSPGRPGENEQKAARKHLKDNDMLIQCFEFLEKVKECGGEGMGADAVPLSSLIRRTHKNSKGLTVVGRIGGDASGSAWSVINIDKREAMAIVMPENMRKAIQHAELLALGDPLRIFIIAVAEHMVCLFGQYQWGEEWRSEQPFATVLYNTDSANSHNWIKSQFSENEMAQDLCRLICALQFTMQHTLHSLWWPTYMNLIADLLSRLFDRQGKLLPQAMVDFEVENAKLKQPYRLLRREEIKPAIFKAIKWIEEADHAFSSLSPIHLEAEEQLNGVRRESQQAGLLTSHTAEETHCAAVVGTLTMDTEALLQDFKGARRGTEQVSARQQLRAERESHTTTAVMSTLRNSVPAFSVAFIGVGHLIGAYGTFKTGLFKPRWSAEVNPVQMKMWEDFTDTVCLGDFFKLRPHKIPWVFLLVITLPCTDFATSGSQKGRHGDTGWMTLEAIRMVLQMAKLPVCVEIETSNGILTTNGGSELREILLELGKEYVPYTRVIKMADYGSVSHRERVVITAWLKTWSPESQGAYTFVTPTPTWGKNRWHCARDIAMEDAEVPEDAKITEKLKTWYNEPSDQQKEASFGKLLRIGRLAPGMGPSWRAHLCLHWDGTVNGPTGFGGGGTFPPLDYQWGDVMKWRRKLMVPEHYRVAGTSVTLMAFHMKYDPSSASLIQGVNQGFATAVTYCWDTCIAEHALAHGALPDMPNCAPVPGQYVTTSVWYGDGTDKGGRTAAANTLHVGLPEVARPSATECLRVLRDSDRDWTQPMHPGKHQKDRALLMEHIDSEEWAQQHYFEMLMNELELEHGSQVAYDSGLRKMLHWLRRGYPLSDWSAEHAKLKDNGIFDPAVWRPSQVESVLIDMVLHEAAVRGNAWSTIKVQLYAVRHHNVRHRAPCPLKGQDRLWQLMKAVKKFRGPKRGKTPMTRAMLLALCELLAWDTDSEDLVLYAAVLTAWHFMMRSCEYSAKLAKGRFDMDEVIRRCDVVFYKCGKVITTRLWEADEVELTFGKQKASKGGERRSHTAAEKCTHLCVVRILALLCTRVPIKDKSKALFSWPAGSTRAGEGVRYSDVMLLVKMAAEKCGRDVREFGTHSIRRGGAGSYYLAGATLSAVRLFGRWHSEASLKLYVEPAIGQIMDGMQDAVISGRSQLRMREADVPRPREAQMQRASEAVNAALKGMQDQVMLGKGETRLVGGTAPTMREVMQDRTAKALWKLKRGGD